jgi:hypothetical protein
MIGWGLRKGIGTVRETPIPEQIVGKLRKGEALKTANS